jgi:ABC-type glycerol-3-phosphate transport system permease component
MKKSLVTNYLIIYISAIIFVIIILFPIFWIVSSSFTTNNEIFKQPIDYIPKHPTIENYISVFKDLPYFRFLTNSLIVSSSAASISILFSFFAAFAFSRINFPFKNFLLLTMLATMIMPQISTVLPLFQVFKAVKMMNTLYGLGVLYISQLLPFTIWAFVGFLNQLPKDIEEAAIIDGSSAWGILVRIIFPLMGPALGTFFIINFIWAWGELLYALIFTTGIASKTLSVGIVQLSGLSYYEVPWDKMSAMSVTMIIPLIIIVLIFQRKIVSGLTRGAIKG